MNVKYIKLSRKCRHHTNFRSGVSDGCFYCKRAVAHNKKQTQNMTLEEVLLNEIFNKDRFIIRTSKKNPDYKGKRPL